MEATFGLDGASQKCIARSARLDTVFFPFGGDPVAGNDEISRVHFNISKNITPF